MTVMHTLPHREWTVEDVWALPDDGLRYELIDGALIVSGAPSWLHQRAVTELVLLLRTARRPGFETLVAPFDVVLGPRTLVQPDVLVARTTDMTHANLPAPPVLAVEVISPSSRRIDHLLKRSTYESAGIAHYWVVDPLEPSLTAWDLVDGAYVEVAHVVGDQEWTAGEPYPVTVRPAALVDPYRGE